MPSTESKLIQAGANKVVLPTHIGAERIAELILFPETARMLRSSDMFSALERSLRAGTGHGGGGGAGKRRFDGSFH
jgi:voltage-gated potassium channel